MEQVEVMDCGIVGWMPPPNTGGEIKSYVIRFFTGERYQGGDYWEIQRFFDVPDRHFAKANNLPSDCTTVVYAQIRVGNSAGMGAFTRKFVVAGTFDHIAICTFCVFWSCASYHIQNNRISMGCHLYIMAYHAYTCTHDCMYVFNSIAFTFHRC